MCKALEATRENKKKSGEQINVSSNFTNFLLKCLKTLAVKFSICNLLPTSNSN